MTLPLKSRRRRPCHLLRGRRWRIYQDYVWIMKRDGHPIRSPGTSLSGSPRDISAHLTGSGTHEVLDTEGSASVSGGSTRSLDQGHQPTPLTLRRGAAVGNARANRVDNAARPGSATAMPRDSGRHRGKLLFLCDAFFVLVKMN